MRVLKEKDDFGLTVSFIEDTKYLAFSYKGNGDFYWAIYSKEKNNPAYNNNPTSWTGYIGLMYPSDYGYATSGDESIIATEQESNLKGRSACLLDPLYNWGVGQTGSSDNWHGCRDNSWLYEHGQYQWFLSLSVISANSVMGLYVNGYVGGHNAHNALYGVRPVLYLKSNVKIMPTSN